MRARPPLVLVAAAVLATACGRSDGPARSGGTGGTLVISAGGDADNLFPLLATTDVSRQVTDQIFDYLADPGPALNTIGDRGFAPRLARGWTWGADSLSIAFHLDPRARWHDGAPVTARDVAFTYRTAIDTTVGSPVASLLAAVAIDSVSTPDVHTAVFWFHRRSPEQFYTVVYNLPILPAHLLAGIPPRALAASSFARHPVGSGRFRFARWDAGSRIVLVSDSANYRGRARLDRVVWLVFPDPAAAMTRFRAGQTDVVGGLLATDAAAVARSPGLTLRTGPGLDYGFLAFNLRRPMFQDRTVRQALSMAVDRGALVRNVFDTLALPGLGPVTRAQATADPAAPGLPFAPDSARRILAGRHLAFRLMVPTSSGIRVRYATLLQAAYRRVGVTVSIEPLEVNAFMHRLVSGDYDAVLNAWHTDPTPSAVTQAWGGAARPPAGANFTGYASPVFDALVDSAARATDPARATALYRRAYAVIDRDAPAVWLYEPRSVIGLSRRVHVAGVRPDSWWADLPDWTVSR